MDLAVLPVVIPLLVAAVVAAFDSLFPHWLQHGLPALAVLVALAVCLRLLQLTAAGPAVYWFGGWLPRHGMALGISFAVEPVGAGLAALASLIALLALVFSWRWFDTARAHFQVLLLVFTSALNGFGLTGDAFNLFVFFELMSVSAFALTGYKIEDQTAIQGAFNFAVTNTLGAILVLLGVAVLYGRTGALNLAQIGMALSGHADAGVVCGLLLMLCGFLVKTAVVPFHFWLSEAHAVAPTPVCMMFSGIMVEAGLFAVARLLHTALAGSALPTRHALALLLVGVGAVTAILGAILCFAQRHIKRLLAFSTISHMGIMLIGVALQDARALAGVLIYALAHGLVKAGLFAATGILLHLLRGVDEAELHGRARRFPVLGIFMAMGGLALAGLPPFGLFRGEALMEPVEHAVAGWLSLVTLLAGALTGGAVLRVTAHVFAGMGASKKIATEAPQQPPEQPETASDGRLRVPWHMGAVVAVSLILAIATGSFGELVQGAGKAAARFQSFETYRAAVLPDAVRSGLREVVGPRLDAPDPSALLRSGIGVAVACIVAALGLWPPKRRRGIRALVRTVAAAIYRPLGHLHSGHVGDYAVWLLVGVAAYAVVIFMLGGAGF